MNMSVKELNSLLKSMRPDDAANIKRRRRILKNKGYAASSRSRQTSLVGQLSSEREILQKQVFTSLLSTLSGEFKSIFFRLIN